MLTGEDFGKLFESFERTAFRLETLALYDVEEERQEYEDFLAGNPPPPEWFDNPWIRSMTSLGKRVSRVHVLRSPLSDYLRYELAAYPGNINAGESIGIIDLSQQEVSGLPDHDFWLFDEAAAYRMHYTEAGQFIGAELLPEHRVDEYRGYQAVAMANSVPFEEYRQA